MGSPTTASAESVRIPAGNNLEYDAVVVGAGPAGSATAYWLARAGRRVLLLDRANFPRDKACSEYLGPGACDVLGRLGILPQLHAAGAHPLAGTTVIASKGSRLSGRFALATAQRPSAEGLSVPRRTLDHLLLQHAICAGVEFLPETAVEDLLSEAEQVRGVRMRDRAGRRHNVGARITIGADGLRSIVARRLGAVRVRGPRRLAFVTHVRGVTGLTTSAEMHVGPAGYVGLNPLGNDLTNVALVVPADLARSARGQVEEFLFSILDSFPEVRRRVPRTGVARAVMSTGPFSAWSRQVVAGGALLVGDAADFFDPFTGEGIFSALRGAELAADAALEALNSPGPVTRASLASYRRQRRRAFLGKWTVERMIGYGMLAPALFDRAVGRLGRRGAMAHTLIGVTADFVPASRVLNPLFLSRMLI
jgi:geranylgeranyl reductase family protein